MKPRDREQPGSIAAQLGLSDADLNAMLREMGEEFGDFIVRYALEGDRLVVYVLWVTHRRDVSR